MPQRKKRSTPRNGDRQPPDSLAPDTGIPASRSSLSKTLSLPHEEPQTLEEAPPVTPSAHLLSPSHQRFCMEFVSHLNATKAYLAAYPECEPESARTCAARLFANARIRAYIQSLLDERATITGITADRVLVKLWETATADPRELVEVRVGSCRHCWGMYHQYQYTESEFDKAQSGHIHEEAKKRKLAVKQGTEYVPTPFPEKGGTGYNPNRQANPECPECFGDGVPRSVIKDVRQASSGALSLFGGVKYDKAGNMMVVIRDPLPAMRMVAEHLGLLSDKLPGPQTVNPLEALLAEIRGAAGAGSALPVIADDPERRVPGQVQDVTIKPARVAPSATVHTSDAPKKAWKAAK